MHLLLTCILVLLAAMASCTHLNSDGATPPTTTRYSVGWASGRGRTELMNKLKIKLVKTASLILAYTVAMIRVCVCVCKFHGQ